MMSTGHLFQNAVKRTILQRPTVAASMMQQQQPRIFCKNHNSSFFSTATSRPFRILGIQQIAIGSEERSPLQKLWGDVFGVLDEKTCPRKIIEKENVEEDIISLGKHPFQVEIDLMNPIDPNKTPKVHKPPLNHIGLWVDNLEKAVEWMDEEGVRFTPGGIRVGAAGHNVTFIHPKGSEEKPISGCGVLIELVQAPEEVIDAFTDDDK